MPSFVGWRSGTPRVVRRRGGTGKEDLRGFEAGHPLQALGTAGRHRRRGGLPRQRRGRLHHRPGDQRFRRPDDERMRSETMEYEDILFSVVDGVATITLNRPKVYNAFRSRTCEELIHAI